MSKTFLLVLSLLVLANSTTVLRHPKHCIVKIINFSAILAPRDYLQRLSSNWNLIELVDPRRDLGNTISLPIINRAKGRHKSYCTDLVVFDDGSITERTNFWSYLRLNAHRSSEITYLILPIHLYEADYWQRFAFPRLDELDSPTVLVIKYGNEFVQEAALFWNPFRDSILLDSVIRRTVITQLKKNYSRNRRGACMRGNRPWDRRCEDLRHFLTEPGGCFINQPIILMLENRLNASVYSRCPASTSLAVFKLGWDFPSVRIKTFIEKNVDDYILYCESKPTFLTPVFTQFITTIEWTVWILLIVSGLLVHLLERKNSRFSDIFVSLLRQPIIRAPVPFLTVLVALMGSFLGFRYEALVTSLTTSPHEVHIVNSIRELLIGKNFKYFGDEQHETVEKEVDKWGKIFEIKGVNLSKVLHKRHEAESFNDRNWTSLIAQSADELAFYTDYDRYQSELADLESQYKNITCNTVIERLFSTSISWESKNYGSEEIYNLLQSIASNGIFVLYADLWSFIQSRGQRWKEKDLNAVKASGMSLGLESNILISFQLYAICISVCIGEFLIELILPNFIYRYEILRRKSINFFDSYLEKLLA
jgi:hypothetical protein